MKPAAQHHLLRTVESVMDILFEARVSLLRGHAIPEPALVQALQAASQFGLVITAALSDSMAGNNATARHAVQLLERRLTRLREDWGKRRFSDPSPAIRVSLGTRYVGASCERVARLYRAGRSRLLAAE